jgi:PTH1 family peptidyl-tRNA hydrolase
MRLIVGLGNPGAQYEHTRHNVGFRVMDMLAAHYGWQWERRKRVMLTNGTIGSEKVVLVKPLTYMNNSGEAVGELVHWYKIQPEDILVIYDELDLPIGKVRLRAKGSAGGHNGLANIIHHIHTNQFPRLRVGIGRPDNHRMETINYVLGIPPADERLVLEIGEKRAAEAVPLIIQKGLETAMNSINLDPDEQKKLEEKQRQKQAHRQLALSGGEDRLDSQQDQDGKEKLDDLA